MRAQLLAMRRRRVVGGRILENRTSSNGITPSPPAAPNAQTKRIGNSSAAISVAIAACDTSPMRPDVF
jgi:hypothetical protein